MSETFGPFAVRPGVLQRAPFLIDMLVRQRAGTTAFRLWAGKELDEAYGAFADSGLTPNGLVEVMTVPVTRVGAIGQTTSVIRRGATVAETRRGHTSFQVDPEDLLVSNDVNLFFRLQEQRGGVWTTVPGDAAKNANRAAVGPILIVPPASFYGSSGSILVLMGHAPKGTECEETSVPEVDLTLQKPPPMHIILPRMAATLRVKNTSEEEVLLVSTGLNSQMRALLPNEEFIPSVFSNSSFNLQEIVLASDAEAAIPCQFSLECQFDLER